MSRSSIITKICKFLDLMFPSFLDPEESEKQFLSADETTLAELEEILAKYKKEHLD